MRKDSTHYAKRVVRGLCELVRGLPESCTKYGIQHNQLAGWRAGMNMPSFARVIELADMTGVLEDLVEIAQDIDDPRLNRVLSQLQLPVNEEE